jgi:hypothetical protein
MLSLFTHFIIFLIFSAGNKASGTMYSVYDAEKEAGDYRLGQELRDPAHSQSPIGFCSREITFALFQRQ